MGADSWFCPGVSTCIRRNATWKNTHGNRAIYDHGHLLFLDQNLPSCRAEVHVTFPGHQSQELSVEWKAEIERRLDKLNRGEAKFIDADEFLRARLSAYDS